MSVYAEQARASEQEIPEQEAWHSKLWRDPAFRAFEEMCEKQAKVSLEQLLISVEARTERVSDEFLKGRINGLRWPFAYSGRIIEAAVDIRSRTEEDEDDGR